MLPSYQLGQVLKVIVGNLFTYVVVVRHIFEHRLGFKSLLAQDCEFSISVEELTHYQVEAVGFLNDDNYDVLFGEMEINSDHHLHIWELFHPEGHYNSDKILAELHSEGIETSRTPEILRKNSKN